METQDSEPTDVIINSEHQSRLDFGVLASMHDPALNGRPSRKTRRAAPNIDTIPEEDGEYTMTEQPAIADEKLQTERSKRCEKRLRCLDLNAGVVSSQRKVVSSPFASSEPQKPILRGSVDSSGQQVNRSASDSACVLGDSIQGSGFLSGSEDVMRSSKSLGRTSGKFNEVGPLLQKPSPGRQKKISKGRSSKASNSRGQRGRRKNFAMDLTNDPGNVQACA